MPLSWHLLLTLLASLMIVFTTGPGCRQRFGLPYPTSRAGTLGRETRALCPLQIPNRAPAYVSSHPNNVHMCSGSSPGQLTLTSVIREGKLPVNLPIIFSMARVTAPAVVGDPARYSLRVSYFCTRNTASAASGCESLAPPVSRALISTSILGVTPCSRRLTLRTNNVAPAMKTSALAAQDTTLQTASSPRQAPRAPDARLLASHAAGHDDPKPAAAPPGLVASLSPPPGRTLFRALHAHIHAWFPKSKRTVGMIFAPLTIDN